MIINESKKLNEAARRKVDLKELDRRLKTEVDKRLFIDPASTQKEIYINYTGTIKQTKSGEQNYTTKAWKQMRELLGEYGYKFVGSGIDKNIDAYERM